MERLWLWDRVGLSLTTREGRSQPILTSGTPTLFAITSPDPMRGVSVPFFVRVSDDVELKLDFENESRSCILLVPQSLRLRSIVPVNDFERPDRYPSVLVLETNGDLSFVQFKEGKRHLGCVPDALGVFVGDGRRGSIVVLRYSNHLRISPEIDLWHEFDAGFWETRIDGVFDLVAVQRRENLRIACVSGLSVVWFQKDVGEDDFVKIKERNFSRPAVDLRFPTHLDKSLLVVLDDGCVVKYDEEAEPVAPIVVAKPKWWTAPSVFAEQDDRLQHVLIPCLSSFQLSHGRRMEERGGFFWLPRTSRLWLKQLQLGIWTFLLCLKRNLRLLPYPPQLVFPPEVLARVFLYAAQEHGCVTFPPLFEENFGLVVKDLYIYSERRKCAIRIQKQVRRWLAQLVRERLTLDKKESDMQFNLVIDGLRTRLGRGKRRSSSDCEICNEPLSVSLCVELARWHPECIEVARGELVNMIKEAVILSLPLKIIERLIRCFGPLEENKVESVIKFLQIPGKCEEKRVELLKYFESLSSKL